MSKPLSSSKFKRATTETHSETESPKKFSPNAFKARPMDPAPQGNVLATTAAAQHLQSCLDNLDVLYGRILLIKDSSSGAQRMNLAEPAANELIEDTVSNLESLKTLILTSQSANREKMEKICQNCITNMVKTNGAKGAMELLFSNKKDFTSKLAKVKLYAGDAILQLNELESSVNADLRVRETLVNHGRIPNIQNLLRRTLEAGEQAAHSSSIDQDFDKQGAVPSISDHNDENRRKRKLSPQPNTSSKSLKLEPNSDQGKPTAVCLVDENLEDSGDESLPDTTNTSQISTPADLKREAKKKFRLDSFKFYMMFHLLHVRDQIAKNPGRTQRMRDMTDEKVKKVEDLVESILHIRDQRYLEAEVTFDTEFSDQGNYRLREEHLRFKTLNVVAPPSQLRRSQRNVIPNVIPQLKLCGDLYLNVDAKSEEVIAAGSEFLKSGSNQVYAEETFETIEDVDGVLHAAERTKFKNALEKTDYFRLPVSTFNAKSKEELYSAGFSELSNNVPILKVPKFGELLGIDRSLFEADKLTAKSSRTSVELICQCPQSADGNFTPAGVPSWHSPGNIYKECKTKLGPFAEYMKREEESGFNFFETIANSANDLDTILKKFFEEKMKEQKGTIPCKKFDESMFGIQFGTNIDLLKKNFPAEVKELEKLPECLRPFMERDLLNYGHHLSRGINTVQVYIKPIGSRTPAHMENSLMGSINWNAGPGPCIWFAVPYEYWGKFEKLVNKNGHKLHDQDYWPNEEELMKENIPYMKFEQEADTMVYVNVGTIHWVQSNGPCVNVSWNIGKPTFNQLAAAMVSYDHNLKEKNVQRIPLVSTMFDIAEQKRFLDNPEMYPAVRSILTRALGHQKMYFDMLEASQIKVIKDKIIFATCEECQCEVFNIFRKVQPRGKRALIFCGNCSPSDEVLQGCKVVYSRNRTIEELCKTFDEYVLPYQPS